MTRKGNRKAAMKEEHQTKDGIASKKFAESPKEPVDTGISRNKNSQGNSDEKSPPSATKPLIKQSQKKSNTKLNRKIPKKKQSGAHIVPPVTDDIEDDEIIFNFKTGNTEGAKASDSVELKNGSSVEKQATPTSLAKNQAQKVRETQEAHNTCKSLDTSDKGLVFNQEPDDITMDTSQVQESVVSKQPQTASSHEGKRQSGIKQKARKRKASRPENEMPKKKSPKVDDIFFYCGNLPPGVTKETLKYFFEEDGIHPRVFIKRMKEAKNALPATLTPKQKMYKKNQLQAAKSLFATVIVKTEEEAEKMMLLNGVTMPSPSNKDWDTDLKIVRRLPRSDKFPYKVHVGSLHPGITEEELREYLESRGITPGRVVIIRTQRTQKSKRYGFVWFRSVPEADKAVDLPEPIMRDRPLVIQHSFKKAFKNF